MKAIFALFLLFFSLNVYASGNGYNGPGMPTGFAKAQICSHPTIWDYCEDYDLPGAANAVCQRWWNYQNSLITDGQYITFGGVTNGQCVGTKFVKLTGENRPYSTGQIIQRQGICPEIDLPSPLDFDVTWKGKFQANEFGSTYCWHNCRYKEVKVTAIWTQFSNGTVTTFRGNGKSVPQICQYELAPSRTDIDQQTVVDNSCADAVFRVFCEFVVWFRQDAPLPDDPVVKKDLDIPEFLDNQNFHIDLPANTSCFTPFHFNMSNTWIQFEYDYDFMPFCTAVESMGNIFRAMWLMSACFVLFGGRR